MANVQLQLTQQQQQLMTNAQQLTQQQQQLTQQLTNHENYFYNWRMSLRASQRLERLEFEVLCLKVILTVLGMLLLMKIFS